LPEGVPIFAAELQAGGAPPSATALPPIEPVRRRPDAEEERATQLGLQRAALAATVANQRRNGSAGKFFAATLVIMLAAFGAFAAMLFSFYQSNILPALARAQAASQPHELETTPQLEAARADLAAAQASLSKAHDAILHLQRQYDALALKQQASDSSYTQMIEQLKTALADKPKDGRPADTASSLSAALSVASVVPVTSPVNEELRLLKERNRLTFYADQAIATGSSEAMDNLWRSIDDPELTRLRDGAKAEIIRVQNYYSQLSRLPPDFRLPVQALFHDPAIRSEADLQPAQLTQLLTDQKQPLEVRARAAYVLGGHPTDPKVAAALVQAMTTDPSLDVMKEVQRTLSLDHGMIIPPLNARAAKAWWQGKQSAPGNGR
jgi:hypothetical protein